jgi:hypothetical protein
MFLLVAFVLGRMAFMRVTAVRNKEVDFKFYRTYSEGQEPESIRAITRHFINLFEMPVLFYVGVIMIYITQQVSYVLVGLAWAYVAIRLVHSAIHLGSNDVNLRFFAYFASAVVLLVMWGALFVQLLRAAPVAQG